jgi:hypothetical protein
VRATHALPPKVQLDLIDVGRVWVAGFVAEVHDGFDLSNETVRLLRRDLRTWSRAQVINADPLLLKNRELLMDDVFWRRLGEEYDAPLIVTGTVRLRFAPPAIVQRGRHTYYYPRAGRVFEATAVVIDGRSGKIVSERDLPTQMRYGPGTESSGLGLYFEMMDRARAEWLEVIGRASGLTAANSDSP